MRIVEKDVLAEIKSSDTLFCPRCNTEISLLEGEEFCEDCSEEMVADSAEEIIWHPNRNY